MNRVKFIGATLAAAVLPLLNIQPATAQKMSVGQWIPSHLNGTEEICKSITGYVFPSGEKRTVGGAICNHKGDHVCINSLALLGQFTNETPNHLKHTIKITSPGNVNWWLVDDQGYKWEVQAFPHGTHYTISRDA